jgi:hypothetical protein
MGNVGVRAFAGLSGPKDAVNGRGTAKPGLSVLLLGDRGALIGPLDECG